MKPIATRHVDIVVVTGMSGSGKSTAINALEDLGYYCIDNLPTALVPRFVELCSETEEGMSRVALGLDLRDVSYVDTWPELRGSLEKAGHGVTVVFLEASDAALLRRFSETRRLHPLGSGRDLAGAVGEERGLLAGLREGADLTIDTSDLNVHELKSLVKGSVAAKPADHGLAVAVKSFGYKYGLAGDSDIVLDVRFLPNPYFVESLRALDGLDRRVADFVVGRAETTEFIEHVLAMLDLLLPRYAAEGKSYLTIALGCTGGRHRSVAIAEALGKQLDERGVSVLVRHRDVERGG